MSVEDSRRRHLIAAGVVFGLVVLVGALAAGRASYAVLAPAPFIAWFVWRSVLARLAFVVVGGLLVFVSNTNHLTASKAAFFAGFAFVVVLILRERELYTDLRRPSTIRSLLPMVVALAALVVVSLPVARSHHTLLSPWLRDAASYGLAAAVPLLLWNFDRNPGVRLTRLARTLLLVGGVLSGISLVVQWLGQRAIVSTTVTLHILPGIFLPGALALFCAVHAGRAQRNRGWYAVGALTLAIVPTLAGTRSAIGLLICVVLALVAGSNHKRALLVWAGAAVVAGALALAGLVALSHAGHPGLVALTSRITSIPHTLLHPRSDPSYQLRATQWHVAWTTFTAHPLLGVGPGHAFVTPFQFGDHVGSLTRYSLDSPVVFLAKFGVIGLIALALVIFGLIRFLRLARPPALREAKLVLGWYLVLAVLHLPFDWPLEQKDFTLGLVLLGALAVPRAVGIGEGFENDWVIFKSRWEKNWWPAIATSAAATALLLMLTAAVVALAIAVATRPGVSVHIAHHGSGPPRGNLVAATDAATWGARSCGRHCTYHVRPFAQGLIFWRVRITSVRPRRCVLLDTSRFQRAGNGWAGIEPIRCSSAQPGTIPLKARAAADAAIWAYSNCRSGCEYSVIRIAPVFGLWRLRVRQPQSAKQCFLLNTRLFARSHKTFTGLDPMFCPHPS